MAQCWGVVPVTESASCSAIPSLSWSGGDGGGTMLTCVSSTRVMSLVATSPNHAARGVPTLLAATVTRPVPGSLFVPPVTGP